MQALRTAHLLARLVLLWFALSLGAAIAAPIVKPQRSELICSGAGAMKLLVTTADGTQVASGHALDCPLCFTTDAPPPVARRTVESLPTRGHLRQSPPAGRIASLSAAPMPARGPPVFF